MATSTNGNHDPDPGELDWLLTNFAERIPEVQQALAVSSDGFLLASSAGVDEEGVEQLAAVVSGLISLTNGAADLYDFGHVRQVIVEMSGGFMFVMSIGDEAVVGTLTDSGCDMGAIGYELAMLVDRLGTVLTVEVIDTLKHALTPGNAADSNQ